MAEVRAAARVLDVAAGAGGQTLTAARRVGPQGRVVATDISESILAFAEETARQPGLDNVTRRIMTGRASTCLTARSMRSSPASGSSTSRTSGPHSPACTEHSGPVVVWSEIHSELSQFESADGFGGPRELIIAAGTAA